MINGSPSRRVMISDVQDLVGHSRTRSEWISSIERDQWVDALMEVGGRSLDAVAVLAETVGGPARNFWHDILSDQEKHASSGQLLL
ncbi:hypothetical protein BDZ89DRAFT_278824 [Hymenopellis radicata]|nr:hypothetical protein BDZ89DRAFT_278824 [Hymenopellis radicata]